MKPPVERHPEALFIALAALAALLILTGVMVATSPVTPTTPVPTHHTKEKK